MLNIETICPKSWNDLYQTYRGKFAQPTVANHKILWAFRGQKDTRWGLATSLERGLRTHATALAGSNVSLVEEGLVREFQRRASATSPDIRLPDWDDVTGWLALMQHWGAPTRLLDWTYSFFVGLFFAVDGSDTDGAVWAIDVRSCNELARSRLGADRPMVENALGADPYLSKSATFRNLFAREPAIPLVYRINTFLLNPRLAIQQGLFLCPGDVGSSFESNLSGVSVIKIVVPNHLHHEIRRELTYMNIGRHSLFPGLDGLASSLNSSLPYVGERLPRWRTKRGTSAFDNWLACTDWGS